jgi:hypothetical protein
VCKDGAGVADRAVQQMYGGCWPEFGLWAYRAYDLTDDSWEPTGKFDGCNINLPFAKMINSAFLIAHGLSDYGNGCRQWHSSEDYVSESRAASNRFHGPFYLQFIEDGGGKPATAEVRRFLARDRTLCHCPLFDLGHGFDSPSLRAAALVHEAWHHWQYEHEFDPSHQRCDNTDCDWFYRHKAEAFPFGQMHTYDLDPASLRFLSPYQVTAEFLDDLHVFGRPELPVGVRQLARAEGNAVLEKKFKNPPRYRVGDPKPF